MRFWRSRFLRRGAIQKFIFIFLFFEFFRAFWIVAGYFKALFRGKLRQMPYKKDQFPRIVSHPVGGEGWHARETHAILDVPEKLAVGAVLCLRLAQIGRLRV